MFKRSRRKIVATVMLISTLLLLGTLSVIYLSSYFEMRQENLQMLQRHAQTYTFRVGDVVMQPQPGGKPMEEKPSFQLSTFYSVVLSNDGRVLLADTADRQLYDEETLCAYARGILASGKSQGVRGNLLYLVTQKGNYTLVSFMDNTVVQERMVSLLRNTLIFGGVTLVILFFMAIFLAKRIVRPLEESYQKQKQFISDAGHELKTPVSVVNANADILRREIGENQWLANIRYENERMGLLVRQLLELARTENVSPQLEQIDLSRLVEGETLPFESVAFEKGTCLSRNIQPNLRMMGDSTRLKQLVSVLIDNGLSHSPPGGKVQVRLCGSHGSARFSVINDGEEIPKQQRQHIFERFYRADEARGDDGHFGLGLAIAHAIAVSHKGKIGVECYDGKVEFWVSLLLQK